MVVIMWKLVYHDVSLPNLCHYLISGGSRKAESNDISESMRTAGC